MPRISVGLVLLVLAPALQAQQRPIRVSVTVATTPGRAWALWTTDEGVRSFFAPGSHIDLKVDGAAIRYFESAWNGFVMASFKHRIEHGPIDWKNLPRLSPAQPRAIEYMVATSP